MIHWNSEACRRAGLSDEDVLSLSAQSDSGYSPEVVARFLENLPQPSRPSTQQPTVRPKIVYVGTEVDAIVARNPELFGKGGR